MDAVPVLPCERVGCTRPAEWLPVLLFYAPRRYGVHPPLQAIVALGVCAVCREGTGVPDYLTDSGFDQLRAACQSLGRAEPDRTRTALRWRRMDDPAREVQTMVASIRRRLEPM